MESEPMTNGYSNGVDSGGAPEMNNHDATPDVKKHSSSSSSHHSSSKDKHKHSSSSSKVRTTILTKKYIGILALIRAFWWTISKTAGLDLKERDCPTFVETVRHLQFLSVLAEWRTLRSRPDFGWPSWIYNQSRNNFHDFWCVPFPYKCSLNSALLC